MLIDLTGKVAIVTGGASNIGRGISLQLAKSGATVVIFDRDIEQAEKTAAQVPERMSAAKIDLLDFQALKGAVDAVKAKRGSVDILVNNAGWVNTIPFAEKSADEMDREIAINLTSPV